MNITLDYTDVVDLVLDGFAAAQPLPQLIVEAINNQVYIDRRGGVLENLWRMEEFMEALTWHLEQVNA